MSDHSSNPDLPDAQANARTGSAVPPPGAGWQEQDSVLRDLWMQNKTPQEIGTLLGRSIPAIMTRAARLGLPRRSAPGRKPGAGSTRRLASHDTETIRRIPRHAVDPGGLEPPVAPASLRICLMCLRKFESAGRHNRICAPCKGTAEYAQASALPDIQIPQA